MGGSGRQSEATVGLVLNEGAEMPMGPRSMRRIRDVMRLRFQGPPPSGAKILDAVKKRQSGNNRLRIDSELLKRCAKMPGIEALAVAVLPGTPSAAIPTATPSEPWVAPPRVMSAVRAASSSAVLGVWRCLARSGGYRVG